MASNTIDHYIATFPEEVQQGLQKIRKIALEEVSDGEESISYGVPTIKRNGKYVVYFAGFKKHISLYPVFSGMEDTLPEIATYRTGKGTLQFPLTSPLPFPLIQKIMRLLVIENSKRTEKK